MSSAREYIIVDKQLRWYESTLSSLDFDCQWTGDRYDQREPEDAGEWPHATKRILACALKGISPSPCPIAAEAGYVRLSTLPAIFTDWGLVFIMGDLPSPT